MSDYNLKERIFYHSEKFRKLIEDQDSVQVIDTENFGWENYRYMNHRFRLAHVERYSHRGLEVLHITAFPHKNSKAPIFGFDVVGYYNEEDNTSKINAAFIDCSPILTNDKWHDTKWNQDKRLPIWATIFSDDFIAVKPTEDEYEKVFELGYEVFENWMNRINTGSDISDINHDIEQIILKQNKYCEHQASNKRTFVALKANIGEERAKYFMEEILFPKIKE